MLSHYYKFYNDFYRITDGYIPLWPLKSEAQLGDIFLIRFGHMVKVGNIFNKFYGIYEDVVIEDDWNLIFKEWNIQSGLTYSIKSKKTKCKKECDIPVVNNRGLVLRFKESGDYLFQAPKINQKSIENFYDFKFKLLQQLTAEKFNFTELFIVSSVAKADVFTLIVSSGKKAFINLSKENDAFSIQSLDILNNQKINFTVNSMNNIHALHLGTDGTQCFFKAQKLEVSHQGKELVRKYAKTSLSKDTQDNLNAILRFAPTQILPAVDIFPSKVHELFHFRDMTLNDVSTFLGL